MSTKLEFNESGFATPLQEQLASCGVRISLYDSAHNKKNLQAKKGVRFGQFQISQFNKKKEEYDNVSLSLNDLKLLKDNIERYIEKFTEVQESQ